MKANLWICEICAEEFKNEVDLLAHQFNGSCEREIKERNKDDVVRRPIMKKDLHVQIDNACFTKLKKLAQKDQRSLRAVVERALLSYFRKRKI